VREASKEGIAAVQLPGIPIELDQFLQRDAFSLAIKGKAGTGKTTLALTILGNALKKQNCMYLSTRLATSELFEYHPWVQNFLHESKDQEDTEGGDTAPFVDARLDEPSTLFERITNELMDTSAPLIIIDTWDAVGDFMDREALMTNAKILQIWRQRARAKLVFVIENVEDDTFDNLVDGVIELEEKYIDSRKARRIHFSKLRGVKIRRPWNFFTLNQAVFHSFEPFNAAEAASAATFESGKQHATARRFATALAKSQESSTFLEELMDGRISNHSVVLIESDRELNPKVSLALVSEIIAGYVKKDNSSIILLSPEPQTHVVDQILKNRIQDPAQRRAEFLPFPDSKSVTSRLDAVKAAVEKIRRANPKSKVLGVLGIGPTAGTDGKVLESLQTTIVSSCDSLLLLAYPDGASTERFSGASDIKLRLRDIEGTLFVEPDRPWASFYAVENDRRGRISVEPMV
jgi:KaiC/GvpD/RAD55 family RecA-like ATPase